MLSALNMLKERGCKLIWNIHQDEFWITLGTDKGKLRLPIGKEDGRKATFMRVPCERHSEVDPYHRDSCMACVRKSLVKAEEEVLLLEKGRCGALHQVILKLGEFLRDGSDNAFTPGTRAYKLQMAAAQVYREGMNVYAYDRFLSIEDDFIHEFSSTLTQEMIDGTALVFDVVEGKKLEVHQVDGGNITVWKPVKGHSSYAKT
jgi:hypothetical protein